VSVLVSFIFCTNKIQDLIVLWRCQVSTIRACSKKNEKCNHFPLCPVKQIGHFITSGTTHLDQYSCRIYYTGIEPVSSHLSTLHLPTEGQKYPLHFTPSPVLLLWALIWFQVSQASEKLKNRLPCSTDCCAFPAHPFSSFLHWSSDLVFPRVCKMGGWGCRFWDKRCLHIREQKLISFNLLPTHCHGKIQGLHCSSKQGNKIELFEARNPSLHPNLAMEIPASMLLATQQL
jgi:hypothetical protein